MLDRLEASTHLFSCCIEMRITTGSSLSLRVYLVFTFVAYLLISIFHLPYCQSYFFHSIFISSHLNSRVARYVKRFLRSSCAFLVKTSLSHPWFQGRCCLGPHRRSNFWNFMFGWDLGREFRKLGSWRVTSYLMHCTPTAQQATSQR
jgi:hypothetical protein